MYQLVFWSGFRFPGNELMTLVVWLDNMFWSFSCLYVDFLLHCSFNLFRTSTDARLISMSLSSYGACQELYWTNSKIYYFHLISIREKIRIGRLKITHSFFVKFLKNFGTILCLHLECLPNKHFPLSPAGDENEDVHLDVRVRGPRFFRRPRVRMWSSQKEDATAGGRSIKLSLNVPIRHTIREMFKGVW